MAGSRKKKSDRRFSYLDYQAWPGEERFELIDGVIHDMNAPLRLHQKIVTELTVQFGGYLAGKACEVYVAPFDVRLPGSSKKESEIFDVVQPDISIVCDPKKLDDKGCLGAPDLIVEVVSKSTASRDHIKKRALYQQAGVREYWVVDPENRLVHVYKLINGFYSGVEIFETAEPIPVGLFPGFTIDLSRVFNQPAANLVRESGLAKETFATGHNKPVVSAVAKKTPRTRKKTDNR